MIGYPDIVLMSSPFESLAAHTIRSINVFACNSRAILDVQGVINWDNENETLLYYRLHALEKVDSDWIVFLDTDDAFDRDILSNYEYGIGGTDLHIYPYYDVQSKIIEDIYSAPLSRLFGFHMVVCKKDLAIKSLREWVGKGVKREDICFLYSIMINSKKMLFHKKPLSQKFDSRCVRYSNRDVFASDINRWNELYSINIFNGAIINRDF